MLNTPPLMFALVWIRKVAPSRLLNTALVPRLNAPVPVHVATPALFSMRVSVSVTVDVVLSVRPPFAFTAPFPRIVPRCHVIIPVTVSGSVPVSVPLVCV